MTIRVLLTGAAGFLGAHCLRHLAFQTSWEIVCPVTFRHKGVPERITWAVDEGRMVLNEAAQTGDLTKGAPGMALRQNAWPRVTVVPCDLRAPIAWTTRRLFGEVDLIINFASLTHPPGSVAEPERFVQNNVDLMLGLLEYARTLPRLHRFVHISTDAVYGSVREAPHREWDPIVPENPYAASKAAQEALLSAYWSSYGTPGMVLTTANPIGETQDPEKFVPQAIRKLLDGEVIPIHVGEDGAYSRRAYIDADEVVRGVMFFGTKGPADGADRPQRFNLAGRRELTALDVVDTLAAALGREPLVGKVLAPAGYGARYALDGAAAAAEGFEPDDSALPALARIARWTERHRLWL